MRREDQPMSGAPAREDDETAGQSYIHKSGQVAPFPEPPPRYRSLVLEAMDGVNPFAVNGTACLCVLRRVLFPATFKVGVTSLELLPAEIRPAVSVYDPASESWQRLGEVPEPPVNELEGWLERLVNSLDNAEPNEMGRIQAQLINLGHGVIPEIVYRLRPKATPPSLGVAKAHCAILHQTICGLSRSLKKAAAAVLRLSHSADAELATQISDLLAEVMKCTPPDDDLGTMRLLSKIARDPIGDRHERDAVLRSFQIVAGDPSFHKDLRSKVEAILRSLDQN